MSMFSVGLAADSRFPRIRARCVAAALSFFCGN